MSKPISKDWVEAYFENGVDVPNRRIFLFGGINEESIGNAIKGIYLMDGESSNKKIELFISSYGGDLDEMLGLYDVIQTVTCPISTFAIGKCMSAAPLLLACGKKGDRWSGPNCSFMVHQPWQDMHDSRRVDELEKEVEASKAIRDKWAELMAKHTVKTKKFWVNMAGKIGDQHFDAEKAMEYGIIDQLWVERSD